MNKKGNLFSGVITGLIILIFLTMTIGIVSTMFAFNKGSNILNCPGYVDPNGNGANNVSYNPNLNSDTMTCSIINFGPAFWVLTILFAVVGGIISGSLGNEQPAYQQQYQGY